MWPSLTSSGVQLSGEPHTRLRLFCSPHHQDSALYPTITQLERAAGFRRDDTAEQLEAVLSQATNDPSGAAPLFAALLSIPTGDRYAPLTLTAQKQKKTLRALLAQVEGLAARQAVLMQFEDAHWCDPTSLELLDVERSARHACCRAQMDNRHASTARLTQSIITTK
jgi:predicted ATPase